MQKEKILQRVNQVAKELKRLFDVDAYLVGGHVRDLVMRTMRPKENFTPTDDIDVCLVGVKNADDVEKILLQHFESVTPLVGNKFPVWMAKIGEYKVDFALARKETLTGDNRKEFDVVTEGVTIEQDLERRDFTMNAMAVHALDRTLIDPYDGSVDLASGRLHHTSEAFKEDRLRVYRAARFLSRFPWINPSESLMSLCMELEPNDISNERVGKELKDMFIQAVEPSGFFKFLHQINWLRYHFNELNDCIGIPQNPVHHPEGDVFIHTMHCMDVAEDPFIRACMLCHDLGKANTTTVEITDIQLHRVLFHELSTMVPYDINSIKSIGHEMTGVLLTRSMLTRIKFGDTKLIRQIELMVELHMIRPPVSRKTVAKTLRRLMLRKLTYRQLAEVVRCDIMGRPPLRQMIPDIGEVMAHNLLIGGLMVPVVTGDMLKDVMKIEPSPLTGELLKKCIEWQDRGSLDKHNWQTMVGGYLKQTQYDTDNERSVSETSERT